MTKQEYRAKQKELDAVVDALPEDVAMAEARVGNLIPEYRVDICVDLRSGIQAAAEALGVSQVVLHVFDDGSKLRYFTVGAVTVVQREGAAEL